MYKTALLCFLLVFSTITLAFAADTGEQLTITTYYPSPYGVYKNLRLFPYAGITAGQCCIQGGTEGTSPCTSNQQGDMAYSQTDNKPLYCDGSKWQTMGGGTTGGGASCNIDKIGPFTGISNYTNVVQKCSSEPSTGAPWRLPTIAELYCIGPTSSLMQENILSSTRAPSSDSRHYAIMFSAGSSTAGAIAAAALPDSNTAGLSIYCVKDKE